MSKKQYTSIVVSLIILFVIRIIGIKTIPYQILIAISVICLIIIVIGIIKHNKDRRRLPFAIVCVLVALVTTIIIGMMMRSQDVNLLKKYKSLLIIFAGIQYLVLMTLAVMEIKYKNSKKR